MHWLVFASVAVPVVMLLLFLGAYCYGYLFPQRVAPKTQKLQYGTIRTVAVLIASRNGEQTIGETVRAALKNNVPVYVVSDASSDDTVAVAVGGGAQVLALTVNLGKPDALKAAYGYFGLGERYDAVAILDDDVIVDASFVQMALRQMSSEVAIVVGKNITWWPNKHRWNAFLASRAYAYWQYQLTVRQLQSAFNVMNCISGSNSVYRTELLDVVLRRPMRYIVDDTQWVLDTHRLDLGRVVYAPRAEALLQDPTTFGAWYKQNLRWLWGTFQGVIGHKVGRKVSRFDAAYILLILQWVLYVVSGPITIGLLALTRYEMYQALATMSVGYVLWIVLAAWRLGRPRLVVLAPMIILLDFVYRVIMVHALVKAIRQPTVAKCVWESPARMSHNA